MGRVTYLKKFLILCTLFLSPLLISTYYFYEESEHHISQIDASLQTLNKNQTMYKLIIFLEDFSQQHLLFQEGDSAIDLQQDRLFYQAHKRFVSYLNAPKRNEFDTYLKKLELALKTDDEDAVKRQVSAYQTQLMKELLWLHLDYSFKESFDSSEVGYLLNVELPLASSLVIQLKQLHEEALNEKLNELKASAQKIDQVLRDLYVYEHHFEYLNEVYQEGLKEYIKVLKLEKEKRIFSLKDRLLGLQLNLFNTLESLLHEHMQADLIKRQEQRDMLSYLMLVFIVLGLYLFVGSYLGLKASFKGFKKANIAIRKGSLDVHVDVMGVDEVGHLAQRFNTMIDDLKYQYGLLAEYKNAVDKSAIVLKTDIHGVITYVNEAYEKISLYSKEELIGGTHRILRSKNTTSEQVKELWKHIANKKSYKTIFENVAKNGKSFFVESTIVPLLNREGEIKEFIAIMFDITPLHKQKEKLQSQVYKDELTGLPNRLKLLEDIKRTKDAKLIVLNIDAFKEINTIYGESVGDETLKQMAVEIKNALKTRHLQLYKLSADEFAILAGNDISVANFREDVALLSHYLSHLNIRCNEHDIRVRLSLGAAIASLHTTQRPLISMADMALKDAKRHFRPYRFYGESSSVDDNLEKNYKMVELIDKALKENRVHCCYQGIVNVKTGQVEKYEALIRLKDEKGELIPPSDFVDIAKRSRYYPKLTQKVVEEAIYTFMKREESVTINLSIDDIMDDTTYYYILDILRSCEYCERIVFELLETEEIEFNERIFEFTSYVKKLGCTIAIDDFGSGYSNYAYLLKLGVDVIKIDASLIKDMQENENSRRIVKSIIDISHALGMQTVTEHVHTKELEEIVKAMGTDYMQGFYLHKPICDFNRPSV